MELGLAGVRKLTVVNRSASPRQRLGGSLEQQARPGCEVCFVGWRLRDPRGYGGGDQWNLSRLVFREMCECPLTFAASVPAWSLPMWCSARRAPPFLREAEAGGCTILDGLGMLVNQGVIGVQFWTGMEPDADEMRRALEAGDGVARFRSLNCSETRRIVFRCLSPLSQTLTVTCAEWSTSSCFRSAGGPLGPG